MNCKYYYNGKSFASELELDDFLLNDGPEIINKFGDIVGQEVTKELSRWLDPIETLNEKSRNDKNKGFRYDHNALSLMPNSPNTKPVTEFLSGLEVNGHLLFPEFREETYFKNRIQSWRSNNEKRFTQRELQDFAEEPEFQNNNIPDVISDELVARLISIEKAKWENEAMVGTAIHDLCELFFSRLSYKKEDLNFSIWGDKKDLEIIDYFNRKAQKDTKNLLSLQQMNQVLRYCRNLRTEIENTVEAKGERFLYYPELRIKAPAENPRTHEHINLSGMIDLLVVPPKGDPFIIDYKVSPNDYSNEAKRDTAPEDIEPNAYNRAKKLGFSYQLATYGRMLGKYNSMFRNMKVYVAPIQILDYKRKNGNWNFNGIKTDGALLNDLFKEEANEITIQENLDSIFTDIGIALIDTTDILLKIKESVRNWFTTYKSKEFGWSILEIEELINDKNHPYKEDKNTKDPEKKFSYKFPGVETVYGKTKAELISHIQEKTKQYERRVERTTKRLKDCIDKGKEPLTSYSNRLEHADGNTGWYNKVIRKYVRNGQYEVLTEGIPDIFEHMGIILLKNTFTENIEVLKLTHEKVDSYVDKRNVNKLITQALGISDIIDKSGKNFLLDAVHGNALIMETLIALNFVAPEVFAGGKIHSIKVINPFLNSGLTASNKQILYSYKTLAKYRPLDKDKIINRIHYDENKRGDIKFCTAMEQARDSLLTAFNLRMSGGTKKSKTEAEEIKHKCLDPLTAAFLEKNDEVIDVVGDTQTTTLKSNIEVIQKVITEMEDLIPGLKEKTIPDLDFDTPEDEIQVLYNSLLKALAEESGYDFQQQIKAYDNYKDSWNIFFGHSGLRTDNPGTTASNNLNKITEFIDNCYKRVTDALQRPHAITLNLITKLKKENNISYLGDSTILNSIRIYDRMTNARDRSAEEDWLFTNPWDNSNDLSDTEREFLKYVVTHINYNRFKRRDETIELFTPRVIEKFTEGNEAWMRVPLSYKGTQGKLETQGLISAAKDYFRSWLPSEVKSRLRKEMEHLLTPEGKQLKDDLYAVRTRFDMGERNDKRAQMLEDIDSYDHDLLSVFLNHMFAYKLKDETTKACMLIKAAHADIVAQEFSLNRKRSAEKQYLMDNVKIMLGRNVMPDSDLLIYEYAKKIMKMASLGALGFNPKQIYQLLEGIWKDIGIVWRQEDGRHGFSSKNLIDAFVDVYKEMGRFGFLPTKLERLNQLYRINDMDINVYAQHLLNSHNIFRNTSSFAFRMASRPDFYNRMTLFTAQMRHDGTLDTYILNDYGELEYHFERDPRFDLLNSGSVNSEGYRKQEALYRAMAKQFVIEGATYADGTKFVLENPVNGRYKPLPLAYTNKQARSFKAMADKMYGYYSHEKKALMQASLMGALIWQMNTYWSGKKNQWFAISSVKDRGHFNHYSEVRLDASGKPVMKDGKEVRDYYYFLVYEDGKIGYDEVPVTYENLKNKNIIIPFILWEGAFSEGIVVTMSSMLWDIIAMQISDKDHFVKPRGDMYEALLNEDGTYNRNFMNLAEHIFNLYWNNPNENLRMAYRQNLRQFVYDMSILFMVGGIVGSQIHLFINDYTNDHKDDHSVEQAMKNASLALSAAIFDASTLDFNPAESIGGRGVNWTPFSITMMKRILNTWSRVITGDDTVAKGFLKTFSANRYTITPFIKQLRDPALVEPTEKEEQQLAIQDYTLLAYGQ